MAHDDAAARRRLGEERKAWRKEHPSGFVAVPEKMPDGSSNLFKWDCAIPGKQKTPWERGLFKLTIKFPDTFPVNAPECIFTPPIFHPNVFDTGHVCLSIIGAEWAPSLTVKAILLGIQELLDTPNPDSPANLDANHMFLNDRTAYSEAVRREVAKHPA